MINKSIFAPSMYFKIHGVVIEAPIVERTYQDIKEEIKKLTEAGLGPKSKAILHADWAVDYTGMVYKNRRTDTKEIEDFMNSGRKADYKTTKESLSDLVELIIKVLASANKTS